MGSLVLPAINLSVLLAILAYFLREPLKAMVKDRHAGIRDEIKEVRAALAQAQERYDEFNSKLKAIDAELAASREQATREATDMRKRLVEEARKTSQRMVKDAQEAANHFFDQLRDDIRLELGHEVLHEVEKNLTSRLTRDDQDRLRKDFSTQMGRLT